MNVDDQAPHVLAVNDSPEILALLRELFEEEAFRITTRINSETNPEEIAQIAPNLIILDYSSETETTLLHHLTMGPRSERIPIILCTGAKREIETIRPELDAMGVAVVYKPFDIDHIVRVAHESLGLVSEPEEPLPTCK